MLSEKRDLGKMKKSEREYTTTYGSRYFSESIPKYEIPEEGMPAKAAYQLINEELNLDGNPVLNLASFVTTWMEPEADQLIMGSVGKNYVDNDEYPQTSKIQDRVVNMLARLFNAPQDCKCVGTATIGSSEAIMLGLLAHKWTWRKRREKEGKPTDKPNIVMGADVHTVWEKFAKYFDVELKLIPLKDDVYTISAEDVAQEIDENTIAVGAVIGTTFTGQMDPIKEINDVLVEIKKSKGWDIPMHVDGASGGFVAPFIFPDMEWDFRLEQVKSINASGHKYGLVYPGVGWVIFKDKSDLPDDLIFDINYLGGLMPNYSLNFSKGSNTIIAQYYNLIRLGKKGYADIMKNMFKNTLYLANELKKSGKFELINKNIIIPLVAVTLKDADYSVFQVSDKLREKGWIVPAYTLPKDAEDVAVLRIVVKENFGRDLVEMFLADLMEVCDKLEKEGVKDVKDHENPTLLY
ncbi:glutamate decarboxylase [Methanobacterium petrolearium]|uniref:glutamate decarboxylase n=1 Tax=Methanobacterium petrolearium TaxID=710190 RepID=UPI001AEB734E|nr:glutamate decarboxylase [Methanobacterium petrolearium]MBP1946598.1 glutamate decarboxylase [Methanobacterium petrolearium]BDZ72184.1 glutamate decarboxylase [Methanobacterium petrolearium]